MTPPTTTPGAATTSPAAGIASRSLEAFNARDLDTVAGLLAPDYRAVWPEGVELDLDAAFAREISMVTALPDTRFDIEAVTDVADGRVLVEATVRGTHTGELAVPDGPVVPASGRRVELPIRFLVTVVDGLIVHEQVLFDQLSLLAQVEGLPA